MVAHLGCALNDVRAVLGDSALTPDSGPVAASRATSLVWRALAGHGADWKAQLCQAAASLPGMQTRPLRLGPGGLWQQDTRCIELAALASALGERRPSLVINLAPQETPSPVDGAHYVFGACAALAQVAVDRWTGML